MSISSDTPTQGTKRAAVDVAAPQPSVKRFRPSSAPAPLPFPRLMPWFTRIYYSIDDEGVIVGSLFQTKDERRSAAVHRVLLELWDLDESDKGTRLDAALDAMIGTQIEPLDADVAAKLEGLMYDDEWSGFGGSFNTPSLSILFFNPVKPVA